VTSRVDALGAARVLGRHERVTAVCHVQPDADAIGSVAGLALALADRGVEVCCTFDPGVVPADLSAIPGAAAFVPLEQVPGPEGLVVVLDCASPSRLGAAERLLEAPAEVLVVDHHASNPGFGDHLLLDPAAASTATLVTAVLDAAAVPIGADAATALYAGLVTDTGSFRWGGPGAHETASRLSAAGADTALCAFELLDAHPFSFLAFLGELLSTARLDRAAAGRAGAVWLVVDHDHTRRVPVGEVESLVAHLRGVREAAVAVVLKEYEPGSWSVSMRSRDGIDVSRVATALGGGGHPAAAGCTVPGTAGEVEGWIRGLLD